MSKTFKPRGGSKTRKSTRLNFVFGAIAFLIGVALLFSRRYLLASIFFMLSAFCFATGYMGISLESMGLYALFGFGSTRKFLTLLARR